MKYIDMIAGRGHIAVGDKTIGEVRYQISVWQTKTGDLKNARGHIDADATVLERAFHPDPLTLHLENCGKIAVLVTQLSAGSIARIEVGALSPVQHSMMQEVF